jgi:hypothetical protein
LLIRLYFFLPKTYSRKNIVSQGKYGAHRALICDVLFLVSLSNSGNHNHTYNVIVTGQPVHARNHIRTLWDINGTYR